MLRQGSLAAWSTCGVHVERSLVARGGEYTLRGFMTAEGMCAHLGYTSVTRFW